MKAFVLQMGKKSIFAPPKWRGSSGG